MPSGLAPLRCDYCCVIQLKLKPPCIKLQGNSKGKEEILFYGSSLANPTVRLRRKGNVLTLAFSSSEF